MVKTFCIRKWEEFSNPRVVDSESGNDSTSFWGKVCKRGKPFKKELKTLMFPIEPYARVTLRIRNELYFLCTKWDLKKKKKSRVALAWAVHSPSPPSGLFQSLLPKNWEWIFESQGYGKEDKIKLGEFWRNYILNILYHFFNIFQ